VLVVDDDARVLAFTRDALAMAGFQARTAHTVPQAIEALRSEPPDLVITDLLMPEGGGRAVIAAVRELSQPVPVLVTTGRVGQATEEEVAGLDVGACLYKPFNLTDLLRTVRELLDREAATG